MNGLFITLILWLVGSVILLWSTSVEALKNKNLAIFMTFFLSVIVMDTIAALIFYESWHLNVWIVIRFLWLIPFAVFLIMWIKLLKDVRRP